MSEYGDPSEFIGQINITGQAELTPGQLAELAGHDEAKIAYLGQIPLIGLRTSVSDIPRSYAGYWQHSNPSTGTSNTELGYFLPRTTGSGVVAEAEDNSRVPSELVARGGFLHINPTHWTHDDIGHFSSNAPHMLALLRQSSREHQERFALVRYLTENAPVESRRGLHWVLYENAVLSIPTLARTSPAKVTVREHLSDE